MADERIPDEVVERYKKVAVATVYGGVRRQGYEPCFMRGIRNFTPGQSLVGRARTLRFIPPRPDIMKEVHNGEDSPEYRAMGSCGPGDVLVCDAMGREYAAIGGDVKLLQLKMVGAEGVVTDGAIRDLDIIRGYGLKIFAKGRTPTGGAPEVDSFEDNVTIGCGGVAVRPGDLIVADDDGVVVVARQIAAEVIDWVEEHEQAEEYVKSLIEKEGVAPGKYYPITEETVRLSRE
jgi:5-oxopent-3-ene-1,2,5-tricarboxylate decarboxylase/2-hydroxyhepta-2,4-diene-1,7-dioate isomerase